MNKHGSFNDFDKMGFPVWDYDYPADRGEFTGTLVHKRWVPKRGLVCYFDTDQGEKYKLGVWYYCRTEKYRPRIS